MKDNHIKQLTSKLIEYIEALSLNYNLHITLGDLKGIRRRSRKGRKYKYLRKRINSWSYYQLTQQIEHKLKEKGLIHRYKRVNEAYTSSKCWKCGKKGSRNKQSIFHCNNYYCEVKKINADRNGAANIALIGKKVFNKEFSQMIVVK